MATIKKPKLPRKPKAGKKPRQSASLETWERYVKREEEKQKAWKSKCDALKKDYTKKISAAKQAEAKKKSDETKKKALIARSGKIGK